MLNFLVIKRNLRYISSDLILKIFFFFFFFFFFFLHAVLSLHNLAWLTRIILFHRCCNLMQVSSCRSQIPTQTKTNKQSNPKKTWGGKKKKKKELEVGDTFTYFWCVKNGFLTKCLLYGNIKFCCYNEVLLLYGSSVVIMEFFYYVKTLWLQLSIYTVWNLCGYN